MLAGLATRPFHTAVRRRALPAGLLALAIGAALAVSAPAAAGIGGIASHRAIYTLALGMEKPPGSIVGAKGAMLVEWARSCDGWETQQRIRIELLNKQGEAIDIDSSFTSTESPDGLRYRFSSRTVRNQVVEEDLRGKARLDGPGEGGEAVYSRPEGRRVDLPAGTLFPSAHTLMLLDAARAGRKLVTRPVFDGATGDGLYDISAVIAGRKPADAAKTFKPLAAAPYWRIRLAYFPDVHGQDAVPRSELGVGIQDNGVIRLMVLDYGSFVIHASLAAIESVSAPKC